MIGAVSGIRPQWGVMPYMAEVRQMERQPVYAQGMRLRLSGEGTMPVQPVEGVRPLGAPIGQGTDGIDLQQKITQGQFMDPAELAVRMRMQDTAAAENLSGKEIESAQEIMEEGECQTCAERKYQDGSDDMGVSFRTPAHIAPETAAATVRGHEMEHVARNQAKAAREGKEVVSQSVTLHTAICPECGKVYVSGGTTRTTTVEKQDFGTEPQIGENFSAVA